MTWFLEPDSGFTWSVVALKSCGILDACNFSSVLCFQWLLFLFSDCFCALFVEKTRVKAAAQTSTSKQ